MEPPPPPRRRMKDKQKKKKERTWAEAARLVRRAARGAAAGGLGGGLPRGSRGGGGARPCPPQQGAGPPGCGAPKVPGLSRLGRLFLHTPLNSYGGASWQASPPLRAPGLQPPLPHVGSSRGSRVAPFILMRELGFRERSEVLPLLLRGQWSGSLNTAGVGKCPWFQGHEKHLESWQFKPGVCRKELLRTNLNPG